MALAVPNKTQLSFECLAPMKIPLVQRFYKHHYPSSKPKKNETILIAREKWTICAAVRFRPIDAFSLLTGMAVAIEKRGQGIGDQLLDYCHHQKILTDITYCFTFRHLTHFYGRHGFRVCQTHALPAPIQNCFTRYIEQGKDLIAMQWCPKTLP